MKIAETHHHKGHTVEVHESMTYYPAVYFPVILDEWGYEVYTSSNSYGTVEDARSEAISTIDNEVYIRDMLFKYDGDMEDIAKYDEELRKSL